MNRYIYKLKNKWNEFGTGCDLMMCGPGGPDCVSLTLYFDYEREYGNIRAKDSGQAGYERVLDTLTTYHLKTTWCCVGLIAEHYPDTIVRLRDCGHEIASHTHRHINPLKVDRRLLRKDLALTGAVFSDRFDVRLDGFHPPEDGWCRFLPDDLSELGFSYAILKKKNKNEYHPALCHAFFPGRKIGKSLLRIPSVCDDWGFIDGQSITQVSKLWVSCLDSIKRGSAVAMGFHPWVLGEAAGRFQAFVSLLDEIAGRKNIRVFTGREIAYWYCGSDQ